MRGIDQTAVNARMRALKAEKQQALEARGPERLRALRRQYHRLNHQIHAHMA